MMAGPFVQKMVSLPYTLNTMFALEKEKPVSFQIMQNLRRPKEKTATFLLSTEPLKNQRLMKNCLAILFLLTLFTSIDAQSDSTVIDTVPIAAPDLNFDVEAVDKIVLLKWNVAFSDDLKGFDIERSENGEENFVKVGSKLAISKSSNAEYDFVDATPKRNVLLRYRLKMISQNGSFSYSDFRETKLPDATFTAKLKQNPVRNNLELELVSATANPATVMVIAISGQQ